MNIYHNKYMKYKTKYVNLLYDINYNKYSQKGGKSIVKLIYRSQTEPNKFMVKTKNEYDEIEDFDLDELLTPYIPYNKSTNTYTCCTTFFDLDKDTLKEKILEFCSKEENKGLCLDKRLGKYYKDEDVVLCPILLSQEWKELLNKYVTLLKFIYSIRLYYRSIGKSSNIADCYLITIVSLIRIENYNIKLDDLECIKYPDQAFIKSSFPNTLKYYLILMKSLIHYASKNLLV